VAKHTQKEFYVEGRAAVSVGLMVSAKSLDEVVEKSKSLKLEDFVTILGDHNDSNFRVTGVYESSSLPEA
jgi:hypothetical protein